MEQFREDMPRESPDSIRLRLDEFSLDDSGTDLLAADEVEEIALPEEESTYTDDPVRTYLREMGAISLLTRQGEVELARRMERGKLRVRKVLSRSPLLQRMVLDMFANVRRGDIVIDELIETGLVEQRIQPRIEGMARRFRQVRGRDPQGRLLDVSSSHSHARQCSTTDLFLANDRIN